jgi:hypothetical protein
MKTKLNSLSAKVKFLMSQTIKVQEYDSKVAKCYCHNKRKLPVIRTNTQCSGNGGHFISVTTHKESCLSHLVKGILHRITITVSKVHLYQALL